MILIANALLFCKDTPSLYIVHSFLFGLLSPLCAAQPQLRSMPYALCSMPYSLCPMHCAAAAALFALCPLPYSL